MRKLPLWTLWLVLPSLGLTPTGARAQDGSAGIYYVRERQFWIPFDPVPTPHLVKQVQLFVSQDQGRRWDPSSVAAPDRRQFHFTCPADGLYWFSVQTVLQDGKLFPASMEGAQPTLRVVVDTIPPLVHLRPLPARNGEVGVGWEIRDEYFDENQLDAVRL